MKNYIKPLAAAVAIAAGSTAYAQQHNNSENTGQVLMFPYYNVENSSNTYMHIHNTTGEAKAVKVRFMEFKNSAVVLEFNVYLGPYDVFPMALASTPEGGAAVLTNDNTCTIPELGTANAPYDGTKSELSDGSIVRTQPFVPYQYSTDVADGLDRTLVGHAEVIEMGVVSNTVDVTDCSDLKDLWNTGAWATNTATNVTAPTGGLGGSSFFINPALAYSTTISPVAIADWAKVGVNYHKGPGTLSPELTEGVAKATIYDGEDYVELDYSLQANGGALAATAVMATAEVNNEVQVEDFLAAETDWVLTFPTKKYFTNGTVASAPFTEVYDGTEAKNVACEPVNLTQFNRESTAGDASGTFVPSSSAVEGTLCNAVSVVSFAPSSALLNTDTTAVGFPFQSGWASMGFEQKLPADDNGVTVEGLPVIGFATTRIVNGPMSYGYATEHKSMTITSN